MAINSNQTYRFKRNAEHYDSMRKLIELGVFSSYRDIMMLSSIIGYNNGLFVPIKKVASDTVQIITFSETDCNFMDILAYCHTKEQSIVQNDGKYEIFECYANGGYPVLLNCLKIDFSDTSNFNREMVLKNIYARLVYNNFRLD